MSAPQRWPGPVGEVAGRDDASVLQLLDDVRHRMVTGVVAALGSRSTVAEWAVLTVLSDDVGHPMSQVAELTHMLPPTATKLVDRMVADGLVYRSDDPVDRRRVLAHSTERGRQRHRLLQSLVDAAVADLVQDDRLRDVVCELHRRVVAGPHARRGVRSVDEHPGPAADG